MPTESDNSSIAYAPRAPAPLVFSTPTRAQPTGQRAAAPPPLETPEERAAREARNALIAGGSAPAGGYIAPGAYTNPDPNAVNAYGEKPGDPRYDAHYGDEVNHRATDAAVASGNQLPGAYQYEG